MNSKHTKRALLGSFTSLLLCFAMLIGSTFAWFTDTATTGVNQIKAGTLKVDIVDETSGNSIRGQSISFVDVQGNANILWEPGATFRTTGFQIVNKGDLALKYQLTINGINGDAELLSAIDFSIVTKNADNTYTAVTPTDLVLKTGNTENTSVVYYIQGTMKTTAGNEYQGKTLTGVGITVQAGQAMSEVDSTDNTYDRDATYGTAADNAPSTWDGSTTEDLPAAVDNKIHITSAAQFAKLMEETSQGLTNSAYSGKTLVLDCNIDFGGATISGVGSAEDNFAGTFDGNGYSISNFKISNTTTRYAGLFNQVSHGGTIKNLTVKNATIEGRSAVGAVASSLESGATIENCKAINCVVSGNHQVGGITGYIAPVANVTGCYAENCTVIYGPNPEYQDTDCQIIGYNNLSGNTNSTVESNTYSNVTVGKGVSTADALSTAIQAGGTVILTSDIDGASWTPASVTGGHTGVALVIDGNGHTITGLTKSLLKVNPTSALTVKNLTIKDSNIAYSAGSVGGNGAILPSLNGYPVTLENCHLENVTVNDGEGNYQGVGGFIGQNDSANLSISGCTVKNCNINGGSNHAGAIIGHYTSNSAKTATISNCSVTGGSVSGSKAGQIVGCVNGSGTLNINGCTFTATACGRVVNANVLVDGTAQ